MGGSGGESEDKSTINSEVVECNLNTEESKEFQDFDPKVNDDKLSRIEICIAPQRASPNVPLTLLFVQRLFSHLKYF